MFLKHSLVILLAIALTLFFKSFFVDFAVPILAILVILYIISSRLKKKETINLFILTSLVLVLIFSTGGISSPLFFLFYFLSFVITFLFDPKTVFVFTAGLIVLFLSSIKLDSINNLIMLFSLLLLSPLSYYFGKSRKKAEDVEKKAEILENDIEEVLYDDSQKLENNTSNKLNEALKEAEEIEEETK